MYVSLRERIWYAIKPKKTANHQRTIHSSRTHPVRIPTKRLHDAPFASSFPCSSDVEFADEGTAREVFLREARRKEVSYRAWRIIPVTNWDSNWGDISL